MSAPRVVPGAGRLVRGLSGSSPRRGRSQQVADLHGGGGAGAEFHWLEGHPGSLPTGRPSCLTAGGGAASRSHVPPGPGLELQVGFLGGCWRGTGALSCSPPSWPHNRWGQERPSIPTLGLWALGIVDLGMGKQGALTRVVSAQDGVGQAAVASVWSASWSVGSTDAGPRLSKERGQNVAVFSRPGWSRSLVLSRPGHGQVGCLQRGVHVAWHVPVLCRYHAGRSLPSCSPHLCCCSKRPLSDCG